MIYRIRSYHGGLGDELQFSTLPELLTKQGHEVYLLKDPDGKYVKPFRNEEIKKLVWGSNPYIKGELEGEWNCGDIPGLKYENSEGSFIKNWEKAYGLQPQNDLPNVYHYTNATSAYTLIELSSLTLKYDETRVKEAVYNILEGLGESALNWRLMRTQFQANPIRLTLLPQECYDSLHKIFTALCSAKCFITLNSGLHSLAAAALHRNPGLRVICLLPKEDYHWIHAQQKFMYKGIEYRVV